MSETADEDFSLYPSDTQIAVDKVKEAFATVEKTITLNCPMGRRRDFALTNLETSAMYAVKSIFEP